VSPASLPDVLRALLRRAAWAPIVVFSAHLIVSRGMHAYLRWPPLDVPMHFLGGVAIAFFFERTLGVLRGARWLEAAGPRLDGLLLIALLCSSTVVWEFAEFGSDRLIGTQAQLGLEDTLADMAVGIAGGLAWIGDRAWCAHRRR
jgi:hypothetical protein